MVSSGGLEPPFPACRAGVLPLDDELVGSDGFAPSSSVCGTDILLLDDEPAAVRVLRFERRFRAPEARVLPGWTIPCWYLVTLLPRQLCYNFVGVAGIEPAFLVSKANVLPLDDTPSIGTKEGIRTLTVLILNQTPPTNWATLASLAWS